MRHQKLPTLGLFMNLHRGGHIGPTAPRRCPSCPTWPALPIKLMVGGRDGSRDVASLPRQSA
eukprot:8647163-Prorocentrum_lima.AAC.1